MQDENIINLLNKRGVFGDVNNARLDRGISRSLLKSTKREYRCTWGKKIKHGFTYNGQLYLGSGKTNFYEYYQGCFNARNQPHLIRTHIEKTNRKHGIGLRQPGWRIRDTLLYDCCATRLNDCIGLNAGLYQLCLFALTSDSYLIQYVQPLRSGWEIKRKIYLGGVSFTHMNFDDATERFVVKSRHNPILGDRDVRLYFVVFYTCPFELQAVFAVTKSIFGNFKDAFVINNMLIVLDNKFYSFYNLNEIIEKFIVAQGRDFKLLDEVKEQCNDSVNWLGEIHDGQPTIVGKYPCGLPVNVQIRELPELLLRIPSSTNIRGLTFGGYPWYCLASYEQSSKLYSLETGLEVGALQLGNYCYASLDDEKKTYFHGDRSGRLLSLEYDEIKCLKVKENTNSSKIDFETCFTIKYPTTQHEYKTTSATISQQQEEPRYSKSGRILQKRVRDELSEFIPSEIVHAIDYDGELDILAVLYTRFTHNNHKANKYCISMYDNKSGREIRTFELDTAVSDTDSYEWNLFMDGLTVFCKYGCVGSGAVSNVFAYILEETCC